MTTLMKRLIIGRRWPELPMLRTLLEVVDFKRIIIMSEPSFFALSARDKKYFSSLKWCILLN